MTAATEGGAGAGTAPAASRMSAGAKLRAAREAMSLSIDAVAQQLKLAPRQVLALENDDYGRLPGRTFVRGFARNYARFVHLDPDAVLALLPAADTTPALERPGLGPSRRPMGELPTDRAPRPSILRWFFPLLLLVIVAVAGYYEYLRQHGMLHALGERVAGTTSTTETPAGRGVAAGGVPDRAPTALPNPLAGSEAAPARAGDGPEASGAGVAAGVGSVPAGTPSTAPNSAAGTGSMASNSAAGTGPTAPNSAAGATPMASTLAGGPSPEAGAASRAASAAVPAGGAPLVLKFNGPSWVEVRDASGRVVLKATEAGGTTRSIEGPPPFQLTVGNAPQVSVTFRGQPLD
ncbi:MAG: RodZ domain-containing protein, partial [Casimicrobiaceae bacterium]